MRCTDVNAEVNTEIISSTQSSKRAHGSKVERQNEEGWKDKKGEELEREGVGGKSMTRSGE